MLLSKYYFWRKENLFSSQDDEDKGSKSERDISTKLERDVEQVLKRMKKRKKESKLAGKERKKIRN